MWSTSEEKHFFAYSVLYKLGSCLLELFFTLLVYFGNTKTPVIGFLGNSTIILQSSLLEKQCLATIVCITYILMNFVNVGILYSPHSGMLTF